MSSIEYRRSNGRETWRVRFRQDRRNLSRAFTSLEAAESWRTVLDQLGPVKALSLLSEDRPDVPLRTVPEQVAHHIAHLTGVTSGTRRRYEKINARVITPAFQSVLLPDLTRDLVAAWVNEQADAGASRKTIANRHSLLSAALTSAERDRIIPGNVAKGVRLPKDAPRDEMVLLEPGDLAVLLGLTPDRWQPFVTFLFATGLRFGEATALQVQDVDIRVRSIRIRRAWKYDGGRSELGPPKSKRSRRTISYPAQIDGILRERAAGRARDAFVWTNTRGNPVRNGPFHEMVWQPLMERYTATGRPRMRVHDARHTYASWAIRAGVHLPVLQAHLGHESIVTTVDTYGHLVRADMDDLAARIGGALPAIASSAARIEPRPGGPGDA